MDVAEDRGDDDFSLILLLHAGILHERFYHPKGSRNRVGGKEELRKEFLPDLEIFSHQIKGGDDAAVDYVDGSLPGIEEFLGDFRGRILEALANHFDERLLVVGEVAWKIDFCRIGSGSGFRFAFRCGILLGGHDVGGGQAVDRRVRSVVFFDVRKAVLVVAGEGAVAVVRLHHRLGKRIYDAGGESRVERHGEKAGIHDVASGKTERDVGDTQNELQPLRAELLFQNRDCAASFQSLLLLGRDRERERVYHDVADGDSVLCGLGDDFPRHGAPSFGRGRDSVLVDAEGDDRAAVVGDERKHLVHHVLPAVHGIDESLSVVVPQALLQDRRLARIELERCVERGLNRLHSVHHRLRLVDSRKPHVHVEDLRAGVYLAFRLLQNEIHVVRLQSHLHLLFSGRVYPFPDNLRTCPAPDLHRGIVGADESHVAEFFFCSDALGGELRIRVLKHGFFHGGDVGGRRSATASEQGGSLHTVFQLRLGERIRVHEEDRLSVYDGRDSRVRLNQDGRVRVPAELPRKLLAVCKASAAVEPENVHPESLKVRHAGENVRARERPEGFLERGCGDNWKGGVLLHGENRGLHLVQVAHRLDYGEFRAIFFSRRRRDLVRLVRFVERHVAHRLKQAADLSRIPGDIVHFRVAVLFAFANRVEHYLHLGLQILFERVVGRLYLERIYPERVRGQDVRARVQILPVDFLYQIRVRYGKVFGNVVLCHARRLNHRSHSTVEKHRLPLLYLGLQEFPEIWLHIIFLRWLSKSHAVRLYQISSCFVQTAVCAIQFIYRFYEQIHIAHAEI